MSMEMWIKRKSCLKVTEILDGAQVIQRWKYMKVYDMYEGTSVKTFHSKVIQFKTCYSLQDEPIQAKNSFWGRGTINSLCAIPQTWGNDFDHSRWVTQHLCGSFSGLQLAVVYLSQTSHTKAVTIFMTALTLWNHQPCDSSFQVSDSR